MTKRFIESDVKHDNINKNYKNGNAYISCIDKRASIYASIGVNHSKISNKQSFLFFTNKKIYRHFYNIHKNNPLINLIHIQLPNNNLLINEKVREGWLFLSEIPINILEDCIHNCHSAISLDRNIKNSSASKLTENEIIGLIASYIAQVINDRKLENNKDSFYICEGTTLVELIISYILDSYYIQTIVPSHSRIPRNKTVIHSDLYESNFLISNKSSSSIKQQNIVNEHIVYTEIFDSLSNIFDQKKYLIFVKRLFYNIKEYIINRLFHNDSFNRTSITTGIDLLIYTICKRLIFLFKNLKVKNKGINENQKYIIFFLHVTPERSVDVLSNLQKNHNQQILLLNICKNLPKNYLLKIVLHPQEIRITSFLYYLYISLKFRNVILAFSHDKYDKNNPVVSISGTIIQERAIRNLPTYHCCSIYIAKGLNKLKYINAEHLISLIKRKQHENTIKYDLSPLPPKESLLDKQLFRKDYSLNDIKELIFKIYESNE